MVSSTGSTASAKSLPSSATMRAARSCGGRRSTGLPLCDRRNPTEGWASAIRCTASSQCANSVCSDLRKRLRAGVLKNRSSASMRVPGEIAAGPMRAPASLPAPVAPMWPIRQPWRASGVRLASVRSATDAIEASASPRKPRLATDSRSSSAAILLVACRVRASARSSLSMPWPLSVTAIRRVPPASSSTTSSVAPASIAFSSSSFRADAGRSMTSPAAIWLISRSGSAWMRTAGFAAGSVGDMAGDYRGAWECGGTAARFPAPCIATKIWSGRRF